jgi:hypothetical protein
MNDPAEPVASETDSLLEKPKKARPPKTQAQMDAFNKARAIRYEAMKTKKPVPETAPAPAVVPIVPVVAKPKKAKKPIVIEEEESESSDDEPVVIIRKKKKKPTAKPKVVYESESEDEEPVRKPKAKAPPPARQPSQQSQNNTYGIIFA